jgi:hypothetical protein
LIANAIVAEEPSMTGRLSSQHDSTSKDHRRMKIRSNTGIARLALCASMSAVLAACGGGGGGSSTSSGAGGQPVTSAATAMTGTVAIGTALTGATVTVTDSAGKTATATSGANGTYNVSLTGLTAPFLITATDPSGVSSTLYSVVASVDTSNGAPVTANVTPLTTAVTALMTQSGNPANLAGNASAITSSAITTAETTLDAAIAPILSANSVPASFDWTAPASSVYPNFWASINSLGVAQASIPATTYDATVWGASTGNTPSPFAFNTPFTDVLTSTATATAEQTVQVQLGWQADGEYYVNTWQYGNP